jgi:hypothetical protein
LLVAATIAKYPSRAVTRSIPSAGTDAYTDREVEDGSMTGRRVWVSVDEEPQLGTVVQRSYTPKEGTELLAVELDDPVAGTDAVVVNPTVDDVVFED